MARMTRALSDTEIRRAKPKEKSYKLFDGQGLHMIVTPSGGKLWKLKYTYSGKEKLLSLGRYPGVTLADARDKRADAQAELQSGINPGAKKLAVEKAKSENTFEAIGREWHQHIEPSLSESHAKRQLRRLEVHVFPWVGTFPITDISPRLLLDVLQRIEGKGTVETAHRVKTICGQIFRFAIVTDRAERDISLDLRGALKPVEVQHMPAITDPDGVGDFLRAIDGYKGSLVSKYALQLAPLVFLRPGELRHGEWTEIDFERKRWSIDGSKMKMKTAHIVPLSTQALEILTDLQKITGTGRYIFPSVRSTARPMSDNTMNAAMRRMGYTGDEMTAHGFRAMARTLLDEELEFRVDWIEHQLAHTVKDPNGRAYNRTKFLKQRAGMMQQWADYLSGLCGK